MSADPLASFRQAVAELQAELYADDLEPPAGAHAWSDEQLRTYYETGGESRPCWPPAPSLRGGSLTGGIAADLEPCPGGSRLSGRLEAEEAEAEEQPVVIRGDVVGHGCTSSGRPTALTSTSRRTPRWAHATDLAATLIPTPNP